MTLPIAYYCETSALNHLADDPDRESVLGRLRAPDRQVRISAYTVAEAAATPDLARRALLLRLARTLSAPCRPLALLPDLLRRALDVYAKREPSCVVTIPPEFEGVWVALKTPDEVDEDARREALDWKSQQEAWYREMHAGARSAFQQILMAHPPGKPPIRTAAQLLRIYYTHPTFLEDFFAPFFSKCGHADTFQGRARAVLWELEPWKLAFAALAVSVFDRGIRHQGPGRWKAGSIDTQQAIYLATCDVFVTADEGQYRLMRRILPLSHKPRRVLSYQAFRREALGR